MSDIEQILKRHYQGIISLDMELVSEYFKIFQWKIGDVVDYGRLGTLLTMLNNSIAVADSGRLGTLLTMLNNSIAVADRMDPTIQESKGEISQHSQQRPLLKSGATDD